MVHYDWWTCTICIRARSPESLGTNECLPCEALWTYIRGSLAACCHGGLLDGRKLFSAMRQDYGIEPAVMHYTFMVDLLGRAGHLDEAKRFISDMAVEPSANTWNALLGACRTYGNVELGEVAAEELLKSKPNDSSAYVLVSNFYAAAGKSEKVPVLPTMMREGGVKKEPGLTWIEVDNKIHEFAIRDTSHQEAKAIYSELNKMAEKLKVECDIPNSQFVLQNTDDEDNEPALCCHSEKLAIVYGLMQKSLEESQFVYTRTFGSVQIAIM